MSIDVDGHAVEAAAMAKLWLWTYLRKAPDRTEAEEEIARDAFISGFKAALHWYSDMVETVGASRGSES